MAFRAAAQKPLSRPVWLRTPDTRGQWGQSGGCCGTYVVFHILLLGLHFGLHFVMWILFN